MKQRPILFSAPMVRALLDGSKTQTRRAWRVQPPPGVKIGYSTETKSPHGQVGDQLWVRETLAQNPDFPETARRAIFRADVGVEYDVERWKPSIFIPRWASRITLEITDVRVERLQDISEADALAEGISQDLMDSLQSNAEHANQREPTPGKSAYEILWEDINGEGSWDLNPWVWVIEFKKVKP